jgi:pimeloyl-ACP methyl ester carboxylesterase
VTRTVRRRRARPAGSSAAGLVALSCVVLACLALAGCGGSSHTTTGPTKHHPDVRLDGNVAVHSLSLRAADGSRIPALLAVPRSGSVRGCLIWQFGAGSRKEDSARVWRGVAELGLATFSIDLRDHGARESSSFPLPDAIQSAPALARIVKGSVSDLKKSVDYLEAQPFCHRNIGYAGVSLGGIVGAQFAAQDHRIRAVVLMSTPGTWRAIIDSASVLSSLRKKPATKRAAIRTLSPDDPARFVGAIAPRPLLIVNGRQDHVVPFSSGRQLQLAAGRDHAVLNYNGGHDPLAGNAGPATAQAISSFVLVHMVEPTFGISPHPNGTYWQAATN